MAQPTATPYPISDFVDWHRSDQLVIAPKFQRRDVWIPKAKSYLIDTILRSMPIPPLFIRLKIDPIRKQTVREVVDGQQRLRAVLGYINNEFPLLQVHNPEFGGKCYQDLPENARLNILSYKFLVNLLEDVSDSDVLGIFARINTYTVRLNAQELRNAEFFGVFKQTVYNLAHQHYAFWRNSNILTDQQIARMQEAELVSELIVTMLDGIRQTNGKILSDFYKKFDDEFPESERISAQFGAVINTIGDILGGTLKSLPFRRSPLFYSLFCAVFDARFGLPRSRRPRIAFTASRNRLIAERLHRLGSTITSRTPPAEYLRFIDAARSATANPGNRRLRHRFIWDRVLAGLP